MYVVRKQLISEMFKWLGLYCTEWILNANTEVSSTTEIRLQTNVMDNSESAQFCSVFEGSTDQPCSRLNNQVGSSRGVRHPDAHWRSAEIGPGQCRQIQSRPHKITKWRFNSSWMSLLYREPVEDKTTSSYSAKVNRRQDSNSSSSDYRTF